MRTGRRQRIAAAWAVRRQPYPAVGTDLPVRFDLTLALVALLDELVKLLMELQECGFQPALLGLLTVFLVVHGVLSFWPHHVGIRLCRRGYTHCSTFLIVLKYLIAAPPPSEGLP